MAGASRVREFEAVAGAVAVWARSRPDVRGVALVGSWARGEAHRDSDIDLVILTDAVRRYCDEDGWIRAALGAGVEVVRRQTWGVVTERRARLPSGLEVEFGLAPLSWASTSPLDNGTASVVREGCVPLVDPDGALARLVAAVASQTP
jgi:predicted nucleotidyltransferase